MCYAKIDFFTLQRQHSNHGKIDEERKIEKKTSRRSFENKTKSKSDFPILPNPPLVLPPLTHSLTRLSFFLSLSVRAELREN